MSKNNIWYLPGPFHQYAEDIKALAKEAGLVIIDANAAESRKGAAKDVPEVTIRPELLVSQVIASSAEGEAQRDLQADLDAVSETIESFVNGDLQGFGDSDLATRVFQVLDSVNNGVQSLRKERDGEVERAGKLQEENLHLRAEIEALRQAASSDPEVEQLKAKLTEAGVTFRANASKESLQKQVAELNQQ
ncbi:hypothetical protein [Pseudomonas putida]|uniref:hypothetical protein n=1 Tax=Pseudomonas putida TaxID=303 RepID=UPI000CD43ABB|nr:hypothetical protein [Pseudomonas putida]POF94355.1 hypothetical protein BGP83_17275 [Pseudomonas putida]